MDRAFVDTNVLISAIDTSRERHQQAFRLIQRVKNEELEAFIFTQILGELYVALTRKTGRDELPLSPKEAQAEVSSMVSSGLFTVLPVTEFVMRKAIDLSSRRRIGGVRFWDVVIIATMLENDIHALYTEDVKDFRRFDDLVETRTPG